MIRPILLSATLVLAACSPRPAAAPAPAPVQAPRAGNDSTAPRPQAQRPDTTARIRPYRDVITARARTDSGVIHVHWVGERLFFEIPDSLLGADFLMMTSVAATPAGLGAFSASGSVIQEQVLRFERRGDRLLLRRVSFTSVAADTLPVARSVRANNLEPILFVFDIRAENRDSTSMVVDATDFYRDDVAAISPLSNNQRTTYRVRRLDPRRTMIDYARSYPQNVEVRHTLTFEAGEPPSDTEAGTITVQLQQSLVLLPMRPMRPRFADPRVGWFSVSQVNFGLEQEQKAATQTFISRWRLEPRDTAAYARGELVEPVKPIVYYIDPATPARWVPWVRRGIEDWRPAFETAGFRNAIIARDAPSTTEDPEWSAEDVRYSSIRWAANMTRNAIGPSVADPRTGEIIDSDVIFFHNHLRSYRNRLLIETAASNPAARTLDMPDSLLGEAIRAVIAHEVGHALGLPHNMIASNSYPVDSLRSASFTQRFGLTPTIMDYARQNYVAQPEDRGVRFIRMLGPYDHYAINWGYRWLPGTSAESERVTLDRWIRERESDRRFRFGPQQGGAVDPATQTEDLSDDPVRASGYGIANLKRVVPNLVQWTSRPREDYDDLTELFGELVGIWNTYTGHVTALVGGVNMTLKATDQAGPVFVPVHRDRQRAAVQFLAREVFATPTWLLNEDLLRRIEHIGALERVRIAQANRLNQLLDPGRMQRLIEHETFAPDSAYRLTDLFDDLRGAIWSELGASGAIDVHRRSLQRAHVERLEYLLTQEPAPTPPQTQGLARNAVDVSQSDIRAMARAELTELETAVRRRLARTTDRATRAHLADLAARIQNLLRPA